MDADNFGAFIASCRREKRMTQSELAARLHVADKAVSRWERGVGFPDLRTLDPLAAALEVSLAELMKAERIPAGEAPHEEAAALISDTLHVTKLQRRQERKQTLFAPGTACSAVILLLFLDVIHWRMCSFSGGWGCVSAAVRMRLSGPAGEWDPAKVGGQVLRADLYGGVRAAGTPCGADGAFFLAGALGVGPVPN